MEYLVTIGGAILGPVFNCMFAPVRHQLEYLFSYKDKIKNLKKQVRELDDMIKQIKSDTERAKNKGNAIEGHVQDWQVDAKTKLEEAKHFLVPDPDHTRARCSCRRPLPNLALRRRLSKEAKEMAEEIERLIRKADAFGDNIFFRPVVQLSFEQKDFEKFETREKTLREMMEALRNPEVRTIGLCGLGGMGKTMLVKEVARLATEGNLFSKQILAVVSQNPNIEHIRKEIADQLDLELQDDAKSIGAERLAKRLNNGEKILIILDDVWKDQLDLSNVGIRFKDDNKECKIILTSRSREVCKAMGAEEKTTFEIKSLIGEEPANLFKKIVGDIKPEFESLATEVIDECGGLPLAIVTTASALQINKSSSFWRNALLELKRFPAESEIYGKVHRSFKTSFDALGNEAKSLLLICSAHDEDENVSLEELTGYVMVLDLFGYVYTLKEASDRVESLVNNLKAYSLLSDGDYGRTVKVHDVIRDVAISIASKLEKNPMYCLRQSVKLEHCLNGENFKELYAISVPEGCGINDDQLPKRLACPRLKFLMLRTIGGLEITDRFFEETKELKALRLDVKGGKKLASFVRSLQNLKALHLRICEGGDVDIAIIGELKNLLILDLSESEDLVALPKEIGNLSSLLVLNLNGCSGLEVIEPNVISRLVQLEELYMEDVGEINASLVSEIKDLQKLRVLRIRIPDGSFVPEDMFNLLYLERYLVQIGPYNGFLYKESTRVLRVNNPKDSSRLYEDGFQMFMKKSNQLRLESIPGVRHIVNELDASSFQDLECLELIQLETLESFMPRSPPTRSIERPTLFSDKVVFSKLQKLTIQRCKSLLSIWTLATVESLQQLKELSIEDCDLIEEVLVITKEAGDHEETESKKITFPKLESLELKNLPKLKRFGLCQAEDDYTIEFPSLLRIDITNCPELRTFIAKSIPSTSSTVEEVEERRMAEEIMFSQKVVFKNLQELTIKGCKSLQSVWALATVERLQQLKKLRIGHCDLIEPNVISRLVQLEELYMEDVSEINASLVSEIKDLPKLRVLHISIPGGSFVPEDMFNHPNLERYLIEIGPYNGFSFKESTRVLRVNNPKDRSLLYEDGFQRFMKKSDQLRLESIPGVSHIVNELDASSFQDLECLELIQLENLESFMPTSPPTRSIERPTLFSDKVVFNNLQELTIERCKSLLSVWALATVERLQQFKKLRIGHCDLIEAVLVITKDAGDHEETESKKITFPKLESLELENLPKLKRFGLCQADDNYIVEFPSLLRIVITNCPELRTFIAKSIPSTSTTVEEVEERRMAQEILFSQKVVPGMNFRNLQELGISEYNNEQYMFSFAMVESLIQLKRLSVSKCEAMEQIVTKAIGEDGRLMNIISFPELESLELEDLPKLKRFCEGDRIEFPSLLKLEIWDCNELKTFIPNSHESTIPTLQAVDEERELEAQQPLFNEKVVATKLTDLVVWKCHGLISLFNSSTATSLAQLTRVFIGKCNQMTQVIYVNDQMEDESAAESEIVLSLLKILALYHLPNLKCFHSGNNKLQFPNLEKIILGVWPEMRNFSHGTINAPNLDRLIIAELDRRLQFYVFDWFFKFLEKAKPIEELWEGDLNRSIRKLWDDSYALQWIFSETVDDQNSEEDTAGHDQKIQNNKENTSSFSSSSK